MGGFFKEPEEGGWGGLWTEKKLTAFIKYVRAYLTIMNKYPFWNTIYFDGFAGSGERRKQSSITLFDELEISEAEENIYKGAAEQVATMPAPYKFDYYYFIEKNEEDLNLLKNKLKPQLDTEEFGRMQFRIGDCNDQLSRLAKAFKEKSRKYAALVQSAVNS